MQRKRKKHYNYKVDTKSGSKNIFFYCNGQEVAYYSIVWQCIYVTYAYRALFSPPLPKIESGHLSLRFVNLQEKSQINIFKINLSFILL